MTFSLLFRLKYPFLNQDQKFYVIKNKKLDQLDQFVSHKALVRCVKKTNCVLEKHKITRESKSC